MASIVYQLARYQKAPKERLSRKRKENCENLDQEQGKVYTEFGDV